MQETISLTAYYEQTMVQAVEILTNIGYPPIKDPVMIAGGEENHRNIAFLVISNSETKMLELQLPKILGIVKATFNEEEDKIRINVSYNCEIIKGREISDIIEVADKEFKVVNSRIDSFSKVKSANNN